jgi:glycosyltransferase involved in cell wall biosynthesis
MRVLTIIYDLFVLAGNVRAILTFADMFKRDGHEVHVVYSDSRPVKDRFFGLEEVGKYHPIRYLETSDFEEVHYTTFMDGLRGLKGSYDLFFTGDSRFAYLDRMLGVEELFYVHWPDRPLRPTCRLWTNSTFTQKEILRIWGRYAYVRHPRIWRMYRNLPWERRDIDVVFFGQLLKTKGLDKLKYFKNVPGNLVYIGANVDDELRQLIPPNVKYRENATFSEVVDLLSRSKVFVHLKEQEHFGIAVAEAAASGCALIVPRSGGPYTDIVQYERYGLTYGSYRELIPLTLYLLDDPDLWRTYSRLSLKAAERFMADKVSFKSIA